jgi:Tol biopolymer transport system component
VAVEVDEQVWVHDLARNTLTRLTFNAGPNDDPTWAPDGRQVVFNSNPVGPTSDISWVASDGSGGLEPLFPSDTSNPNPSSFSADGRLLAFFMAGIDTQRDIWVLRVPDRKAEPFLQTPFNEGAPTFSPDGRWLAYVSNESGRPEIYVQPYPGPGGKWQVSTGGGAEPLWSRSGREIFYRQGNRMLSVSVSTANGFAAGNPAVLFEREYASVPFPATGVAYDVSADGQRFLMVKEVEQSAAPVQIQVIVNWFEELKRLVPVN